jgi:hypothetical protein
VVGLQVQLGGFIHRVAQLDALADVGGRHFVDVAFERDGVVVDDALGLEIEATGCIPP